MDSHKVLGRRILALIIDILIISAISSAMFFPFAEETGLPADANVTVNFNDYVLTGGKAGLYMLASLLVAFLYWVLLVGRTGWSPGKLVMGLRVVRSSDGSTPPGMMKAFLRHLVWLADMFPYIIPGLTGFVVAMTNPRRRRIGDMAAGTEVVKASAVGQRGVGGGPAAAQPVIPAGPPVTGTQAMPAIRASTPPEPPPLPQPAGGPPADWYPDPHGEKRLRYWDGTAWTGHTAD